VIRSHRRCGISHPDPLDGTWIVGRQRLILNHRHPLNAKHLTGCARAGTQNSAQRGTLAHFIKQSDGSFGVTKLDQSGFHGYAYGDPHFDGIESIVVIHEVHLSDGIEITDTAVPTMRPYRFVLGLLGQVLPILVVVGPGAANNTAPMAPMRCGTFAAPCILGVGLSFTADLMGINEAALLEIVSWIATRFIEDVGQDIGAIGGQALAGNRVIAQAVYELLVGLLEFFRILGSAHFHPGIVKDYHLHTLGAHDRPHSTTSSMPGGPKFHVGDGNRGRTHLHLTRGSNRNAGDLIPILCRQLGDKIVIRQHLQAVIDRDRNAVLVDKNLVEIVTLGSAFEDDGRITQSRQDLSCLSPGVGLFDATRQRALTPYRKPAGHGCRGPAQHSRRDHEFVFRSQRMAERRHFFAHDSRSQRPASHSRILPRRSLAGLGAACRAHVNSQNLIHKFYPSVCLRLREDIARFESCLSFPSGRDYLTLFPVWSPLPLRSRRGRGALNY